MKTVSVSAGCVPSGFTEVTIKAIILITGGTICIAGHVTVLCIDQ